MTRNRRFLLWFLILALPGLCATTFAAERQKRIALVIGNGSYTDAPLANPVNDATDMAAALRSLSFDVILQRDATHREMDDAIALFGKKLQNGGVGLFYYAGHGIQTHGRNYLLPVNARLEREKDLKYRAVDSGAILDEMAYANNGLNIMILDACRNNPLTRSFRSSARGLTRPTDVPTGLLMAYSTAPGKVAADGEGRNSPYTRHLLKAIQRKGRPLELVFKDVIRGVKRETGSEQVPWVSSSVSGDFYFSPPGETLQSEPQQAEPALATPSVDVQYELSFWNSIQDSQDAASYQAYLDTYPNGRFEPLARLRLAKLQPVPPKPTEPDWKSHLSLCRKHLEANRLTSGEGGTALDCYRNVLEQDPGNAAAQAGLEQIEAKYRGWTEAAISRGDPIKARSYLRRLEQVNPDSLVIAGLSSRIDDLQSLTKKKPSTRAKKCPSGFFWNIDHCRKHSEQMVATRSRQQCPKGATWNGNRCATHRKDCPQGSYWNADRCQPRKTVGRLDRVNAEWGFVTLKLSSGKTVSKGERLVVWSQKSKAGVVVVKRISGNTVSAMLVTGSIGAMRAGMSVSQR